MSPPCHPSHFPHLLIEIQARHQQGPGLRKHAHGILKSVALRPDGTHGRDPWIHGKPMVLWLVARDGMWSVDILCCPDDETKNFFLKYIYIYNPLNLGWFKGVPQKKLRQGCATILVFLGVETLRKKRVSWKKEGTHHSKTCSDIHFVRSKNFLWINSMFTLHELGGPMERGIKGCTSWALGEIPCWWNPRLPRWFQTPSW